MSRPVIVVHGGAEASQADIDGCEAAARAGSSQFAGGGDALAAVVQAVAALEDDGRFDAGSGSVLGLDGATIEMDASVMDTRGRLGAVACIRNVRNPVLAARAVADSPHRMLAGEGAERFARVLGLAPSAPPGAKGVHEREETLARLMSRKLDADNPDEALILRYWNYRTPPVLATKAGCDTVGAVARDAEGHFAVAASTGGVTPALLGRVGDTPIIGAGFYAGPHGAVAVTGEGEAIIPHLLAHTVYRWLAEGAPLADALRRGIDLFPEKVSVGLIAVTREQDGHRSNRPMPTATKNYDNK